MTKLSSPIVTIYTEIGYKVRHLAGLTVVLAPMPPNRHRSQARSKAIDLGGGRGHHVLDLKLRWWHERLYWVFAWADRPTRATWVCSGHDARWRACMEAEA